MKFRRGFVSNSSSSSFICEVCNTIESGWDASPRDVGFGVCVDDHNFCISHILPAPSETDASTTKAEGECENCDCDPCECESNYDEDEGGDEIPKSRCPICQLKDVQDAQLIVYLLKQVKMKREDVEAAIKQQFVTYEKFAEYLKDSS